eukprot:519937-Hanusia_phi.AAC.2
MGCAIMEGRGNEMRREEEAKLRDHFESGLACLDEESQASDNLADCDGEDACEVRKRSRPTEGESKGGRRGRGGRGRRGRRGKPPQACFVVEGAKNGPGGGGRERKEGGRQAFQLMHVQGVGERTEAGAGESSGRRSAPLQPGQAAGGGDGAVQADFGAEQAAAGAVDVQAGYERAVGAGG